MPVLRTLCGALVLLTAPLARAEISFPTNDGGLIFADEYGSGPRALVLVHGGRFDRKGWTKQAQYFAGNGFRVLCIDLRGEGKSHGGKDVNSADKGSYLDVLGAIHYARASGATSVDIIGASMGGDFSAEAAEAEPDQINRLVLLAAGAYTPLVRFKGPKLFILARDDANTDGPRLPKIQMQFNKAAGPKKMIIVDGTAHAQFLFQTPEGDRVLQEILRFLF